MVSQVNVAVPQGTQVNLQFAGQTAQAPLSVSIENVAKSLDQHLGTINISYNEQSQAAQQQQSSMDSSRYHNPIWRELMGGSVQGGIDSHSYHNPLWRELMGGDARDERREGCRGESEADSIDRSGTDCCGGSGTESSDASEKCSSSKSESSPRGNSGADTCDQSASDSSDESGADSCGNSGADPTDSSKACGRKAHHRKHQEENCHGPVPPGTDGSSNRTYKDFAESDDPSGGPASHRDKVDEYGHVYTWDDDYGRYEACGKDDGRGYLNAYSDEEYGQINKLDQQTPVSQTDRDDSGTYAQNTDGPNVNISISGSPNVDVNVFDSGVRQHHGRS